MTQNDIKISPQQLQQELTVFLSAQLETLGYELVHLEISNQRQKILRLFIDKLNGEGVGIQDCVDATKALDQPLDQHPLLNKVFPQGYELEVSSPGLDRPLSKPADFEKFSGKPARIHVVRPLTAEELSNPNYQEKNPKQKNFLGTLTGIQNSQVLLTIVTAQKSKKEDLVTIPIGLISKANLEPQFEFKKETT